MKETTYFAPSIGWYQTYKMEPTTVDISNKQSVENFIQTLEENLATSEIKISMDLDGNITLKEKKEENYPTRVYFRYRRQGSWTPNPGQGEFFIKRYGP